MTPRVCRSVRKNFTKKGREVSLQCSYREHLLKLSLQESHGDWLGVPWNSELANSLKQKYGE